MSPCDSEPCTNGGKCSNVGDNFECKCPLRYKGKRCETDGNEITYIYTSCVQISTTTQLTQNVVATLLDGRILVRSDLTLWRRFHDVGSSNLQKATLSQRFSDVVRQIRKFLLMNAMSPERSRYVAYWRRVKVIKLRFDDVACMSK